MATTGQNQEPNVSKPRINHPCFDGLYHPIYGRIGDGEKKCFAHIKSELSNKYRDIMEICNEYYDHQIWVCLKMWYIHKKLLCNRKTDE